MNMRKISVNCKITNSNNEKFYLVPRNEFYEADSSTLYFHYRKSNIRKDKKGRKYFQISVY